MTDIEPQSQSSPFAAPSQNIDLSSTSETRRVLQAQKPLSPQPLLTLDYVLDGYISYTFTPRNLEGYLVKLFNVRNVDDIQAIRYQNCAFYVLNQPPHNSLPPHSVSGRNAWLLDHAVVSGGSVVPQQLWIPPGQGDRPRYVDQVQLRMPVFFINANGSLGVPVMSAAVGNIQLHGTFPPQLADRVTIKIRIGVCTCSFTTDPITYYMCGLQWPGYNPSGNQVPLRDQTPQRNLITIERFARHVGARVRQFLLVCLSLLCRLVSEIDGYIGLRARSGPSQQLEGWRW